MLTPWNQASVESLMLPMRQIVELRIHITSQADNLGEFIAEGNWPVGN
jgi:hypothetical protein